MASPSSSSSSTAAIEALALLKVVAAQLEGPSGAALRGAIASGAVSPQEVARVARLAQALAGLLGTGAEEQQQPSSSSSSSSSNSSRTLHRGLSTSSSSSGATSLPDEEEAAATGRGASVNGSSSSLLLSSSLASSSSLLSAAASLSSSSSSLTAAGEGPVLTSSASGVEREQRDDEEAEAEAEEDGEDDGGCCAAHPAFASPSSSTPLLQPTVPGGGGGKKRRQSQLAADLCSEAAAAAAAAAAASPSVSPPAKRLLSLSHAAMAAAPAGTTAAAAAAGAGGNGKVGIDSLPDGTLLAIFDMVWSGRPSYGENDGRKQLGDIALVCRQWRDLANSDELWKPLCIARWPWLKSLKGGPAELLPPLAAYKHHGQGRSPQVWHEFCVRHGRCMNKAGIGRRTSWGSEYSLSVEIFDRKGGFRLFCSYGRVSIMQQNPAPDGRWLTKLAITGFASCWHFSAASRDPVLGRFGSIREYFERSHERALEHCLCTEVTVMNKHTGKMAVLYASSKETKRKLTAEKGGTSYFEEELRPASATIAPASASAPSAASSSSAAAHGGGGGGGGGELLSYLAASGMAVSKVLPPGADPTVPVAPEMEKEQKYRVDRLYLIFSTARRWDVNKIFAGLDWA